MSSELNNYFDLLKMYELSIKKTITYNIHRIYYIVIFYFDELKKTHT